MKRGKLKQTGHLLAGILILIHGFASFEASDLKSAGGYFGVALLAILVAALHKYINKSFTQADVAFFFLEAATLLYSAWDYRDEGKFALSYFIAAAGIGYFLWAIFSLIFQDRRDRPHSQRHRSRR